MLEWAEQFLAVAILERQYLIKGKSDKASLQLKYKPINNIEGINCEAQHNIDLNKFASRVDLEAGIIKLDSQYLNRDFSLQCTIGIGCNISAGLKGAMLMHIKEIYDYGFGANSKGQIEKLYFPFRAIKI